MVGIVATQGLGTRVPDALGGERAGLVHAQRVDARHRLDRVLPLHEGAEAADPESPGRVRDGHHDREALRHQRHEDRRGGERLRRGEPARERCERKCHRDDAQQDQRGHRPDRDGDLALERGALVAQPLRVREEPVREAGGADRLDLEDRGPRDDCAAGQDRIAGLFRDRIGLAGEQGFVELDTAFADERAVEDHLVAAAGDKEVTQDGLGRIDAALAGIPDDPGLRAGQERDPVQLPLRPCLRDHADPDVGQDRARGEERLDDHPEQQQEHGDGDQDPVDPRVRILAEDLPVRPRGRRAERVALAACPSRARLRLGEPRGRGAHRPDHGRVRGQRGNPGAAVRSHRVGGRSGHRADHAGSRPSCTVSPWTSSRRRA